MSSWPPYLFIINKHQNTSRPDTWWWWTDKLVIVMLTKSAMSNWLVLAVDPSAMPLICPIVMDAILLHHFIIKQLGWSDLEVTVAASIFSWPGSFLRVNYAFHKLTNRCYFPMKPEQHWAWSVEGHELLCHLTKHVMMIPLASSAVECIECLAFSDNSENHVLHINNSSTVWKWENGSLNSLLFRFFTGSQATQKLK